MKDTIEITRPIYIPFSDRTVAGTARYRVLNDMGHFIASLQGIEYEGRYLNRDECISWLNSSFIQDHEEQASRVVTLEHFKDDKP